MALAFVAGLGYPARLAHALDIGVRGGTHDDYNRIVFDWPQPPIYKLQQANDGQITLSFKGPAVGFNLKPSVRELSRLTDINIVPAADGTAVKFRVSPGASVKAFLSGTAVVVDIKGAAVAQVAPPIVPSIVPDTPKAADNTTADPVAPALNNNTLAIKAVLFERAAQSYALLERRDKVDMGAITGATALAGTAGWQRASADGSVLTVVSNPTAKVKARITAEPLIQNTTDGIAVTPQPDYAAGGRVLIAVDQPGAVIAFTDPQLGDGLYAVPTQPGQFISKARHFAAFDLLPTRQGIVIRPLNDKLIVIASVDGVQITMLDGLKLSAATIAETDAPLVDTPPVVTTVPAETAPAKMFLDITAAHARAGETFTVARQRLQNAIAALGTDDPQMRALGRLNLVRFYIANGFGQEASGLLQDIAADTPDFNNNLEYRGLLGMAQVLIQAGDAAIKNLSLPELAPYPDLTLWHAAATTEQRDFAVAAPLFTSSMDLLATYPEPFFTRFSLLAGESFLAVNDNEKAKQIVGMVQARGGDVALATPAMLYLRGVVESRIGSLDEAKALWQKSANSLDMLARTRANMALVDLGIASKTLAPIDAAKTLEGLRFGWRGDSLELDLLQRLAANYAAAGQPDEALTALDKAKRVVPNQANAELIETQQRKIFADLFMSAAIDGYPPLKTLATYNRYKQFAPTDPTQAVAINNRLVDKMLKIDLLGPAADLLDQQLPLTADAAAKAKLGARIAGIRLLNLEPAKAIQTLDASEGTGLAFELAEERKLLRARALADSAQPQPALKLLAGDTSEDALRLAATVAWRAKDWPGAAATLAALLPPATALPDGKLTALQAQLVVRRAIALTLAGDQAALAQLNVDYGAAIKATPSAPSFALLTAPEGAIRALSALPNEMKDVDLFKSFLESYRK